MKRMSYGMTQLMLQHEISLIVDYRKPSECLISYPLDSEGTKVKLFILGEEILTLHS